MALRTPLVRFAIDVPDTEIYLKIEVLQPIGKVVAIVSGGSIDASKLATILSGGG